MAGNYDIVEVYIDGVLKIGNQDIDGLAKLLQDLDVLAGENIKLVLTVSQDQQLLPEGVKQYL